MIEQKFFDLAKEEGISEAQLQLSTSSALSFSIYHTEIDNYKIEESVSLKACGIYEGKFGSCYTQRADENGIKFLVENIKDAAKYNQNTHEPHLYKGSKEYHKKDIYDDKLASIAIAKKIELCKEIEKDLLAYDSRITEVEGVDFEEFENSSKFMNSFGLDLSQRSNGFVLTAAVIVKSGEETKTNYKIAFGMDFDSFDKDAFVKDLAETALSKLGGEPCDSGSYPTVLQHNVLSSLINYYLRSTIAEEVQKGSSFFADKLNKKVANSLLTIEEKPLEENMFFSYFDDEGVATNNKEIIKDGVLKTFLYNLETAKKDNVESTGNGEWAGSKMGTGYGNIFVKPGLNDLKTMISPIKEGVFITSIQGLGTGMNTKSGNFSCQAQGFMIENGELTKPLNLITLSGNLFSMFENIVELDSESVLHVSSISCPDVYISEMSIGGK